MRAVLAAVAASAALACAGAPPAPAAPAAAAAQPLPPPSPWRIDGAAAALLVRNGARLVDVRTRQEFDQGHLPGAVLIPHDQMERRAAELGPPSTTVVLYCGTGKRSGEAAGTLRRLGYAEAWDAGPMSAWPAGP